MTVLGNLVRRSLENPELPLTSTTLANWLTEGTKAAGVSVTEKTAYGLTAYYRGIALTSSTMAQLPFKVFRNGTRDRVTQRTVLDNPNPSQTPFEFWQSMYANAIGWGNGFGLKVFRGSGAARDTPSEVWILHPSQVTIERVEASAAFPDGKKFLVLNPRTGRRSTHSSRTIFHLPYLAPDGTAGVSPLRAARQALGVGIAAERTAAQFYAKGSKVSGVLKTDQVLDDGVADRLKRQWNARHAGPDNAGDIAVLDAGAEFVKVGIPPADAELLDSRKFSVTEIARLVGCPPHLLGDVEKSTSWGTGIEQQFIAWVQVTLLGWLTLTAQRATRELLPGGWTSGIWYAEHSVEGLLRGDSKARAAFYHQAIIDGWLNRNEVRGLENLEPEEGLDEFLVPSNLTLITVDGQLVPLSSDGIDGDNSDSEGDD